MSRWLVTGCSTGIGREIARAALEAGHQVVVTARRVADVEDLVDDLRRERARRRRSTSPTAPRSRRRSPAAEDAFGGIDVLVNNAGYGYLSAVEEGDDAEVRRLFDTNYFGVVDTLKAVLPGMRAQGSGHVVNISSMTGLVANPPNAYYSSTKFALEALTEALAKEVGPLGIKVTAIEPGAFRTDWAKRSMHEAAAPIDGVRRRRRRPQGPDQGVRRPPARRPAQGRRGRRHGHRARRAAAAAPARARTCSPRCATKLAEMTASIDEWEHVTVDTDLPRGE